MNIYVCNVLAVCIILELELELELEINVEMLLKIAIGWLTAFFQNMANNISFW